MNNAKSVTFSVEISGADLPSEEQARIASRLNAALLMALLGEDPNKVPARKFMTTLKTHGLEVILHEDTAGKTK